MLKLVDLLKENPMQQYFTYVEQGKQFAVAVDMLRRHCEEQNLPIYAVPIESGYPEFLMRSGSIIKEKLDAIDNIEKLTKPVIYLSTSTKEPNVEEGITGILCDGAHRYVKCYQLKLDSVPSYVVPIEVWKKFIIDDIPFLTNEELGLTGEAWNGPNGGYAFEKLNL